MNALRINRFFIYLIIISLAVSPAFALGKGNRNLLLIGVMSLTPIIIIVFKKIYKLDIWLFLIMGSLALAPILNHPETMRWSTVLYSWMFCLTFIAYNRLLFKNVFSIINFHNLLKYLILAYFITLLIQQFCVLTGLPIFNISNYSLPEPWKLNSLASEPSHSGRIVGLLFYCFITSKEIILQRVYSLKKDAKTDGWIWLAFLWTMVTMGSATAFLFLLIVSLKFIQKKNIVPIIVLLLIFTFIASRFEIKAIDRAIAVFEATLTLDPNNVISADHSASFRIVPTLVLITMVDVLSMDGLFGHGVDSVSNFLYLYIPGGGEEVSGGGFFLVWYEYGFIPFILLMIFSLKATLYKGQIVNIVFWFFLVFIYGINNQIIWLCMVLLYTNNIFLKKSKQFNFSTSKMRVNTNI